MKSKRHKKYASVGIRNSENWPLKSEALAVNPKDAKQAQEDSIKQGVPTEFDKDGCPIFVNPKHRKEFCEKYGFYDRNAGYSDPTPKNITSEKRRK